jgi:hypothetical protein
MTNPAKSTAAQFQDAFVPITCGLMLAGLSMHAGFPALVAGLVGSATSGFCWWTVSSDR